MTQLIWYWSKRNSKIFTKKKDIAEKAMKEGFLVIGKKIKSNIIKY